MQDDRCIASIVRLTKTVQLKPMTTYKLPRKLKQNPSVSNEGTYEISSIENCYLDTEPHLKLSNTLVTLSNYRRVPIITQTCQTRLYHFIAGALWVNYIK